MFGFTDFHYDYIVDILASLSGVHYIGVPLYFDVYKSRTIILRFSKRSMICTTLNDLQLRFRMRINYVEMICTKLNDLYQLELFLLATLNVFWLR